MCWHYTALSYPCEVSIKNKANEQRKGGGREKRGKSDGITLLLLLLSYIVCTTIRCSLLSLYLRILSFTSSTSLPSPSPTLVAFCIHTYIHSFSSLFLSLSLCFSYAYMYRFLAMMSLYIHRHSSTTPLLHHADDERRGEEGEDWGWWLYSLSSLK